MSEHFSKNRNPIWKENHGKYIFAWDHYTGKYIDTDKISDYLFQKTQREGNQAFDARKKDPDPILHFPTAVDGINGIVFAKAKDTIREWGDLGDPEKEGTIAYGLKRNADGSGTNWAPFFKRVGIKLTVMHTVWGLVEGVQEDRGTITSQSSIKVINPQSVIDWYPLSGNPRQVLVKEDREVRESIDEKAELQEVFTLFELDGWKRFIMREEKDGGESILVEQILDKGEYEYWDSSNKEIRVLPIFRVELPLPRHLGYLLAKKQNHIFNYKSIRDHGASNLSLAILKIKASDKEFQGIINSLEKGSNTIREDPEVSGSGHEFMVPDGSHLGEAGKILDTDVEHFYHNAFREFGDAARQTTATEIIQKSSTGIEAFLALLVSSIDEFENQCFLRLLQAAGRPESQWGSALVERSTDFQPQDIEEAFERMKKRFFGESPVPVPNKQKAQLVKLLLEREGVVVEDDEEIQANLDRSIDVKLAEAVSRIAGEAISTEEMVRVLRPGWDDAKVNTEVQRIRTMQGAIPENAMGG